MKMKMKMMKTISKTNSCRRFFETKNLRRRSREQLTEKEKQLRIHKTPTNAAAKTQNPKAPLKDEQFQIKKESERRVRKERE